MISVGMFVIIMDILKYCFRIDPAKRKLKHIRPKKKPKQAVILRFIYVNAPSTSPITEDFISTVEETAI